MGINPSTYPQLCMIHKGNSELQDNLIPELNPVMPPWAYYL